jgi:hypothetical protein
MVNEKLEVKVLGKVDIPFEVVGKGVTQGYLFGDTHTISCYSRQTDDYFRLRVTKSTFNGLKKGRQYALKNEPVLQKYDSCGNPVGKSYTRPSNMLDG